MKFSVKINIKGADYKVRMMSPNGSGNSVLEFPCHTLRLEFNTRRFGIEYRAIFTDAFVNGSVLKDKDGKPLEFQPDGTPVEPSVIPGSGSLSINMDGGNPDE